MISNKLAKDIVFTQACIKHTLSAINRAQVNIRLIENTGWKERLWGFMKRKNLSKDKLLWQDNLESHKKSLVEFNANLSNLIESVKNANK